MIKPQDLRGHEALQYDIDALHADIDECRFHDFKSDHVTPKTELRARLFQMVENVTFGRYDDINPRKN